MNFYRIVVFVLLGVVSLGAFGADRPNIIFVLTDDHGYSDLGAQGILDDVKTPFTDALAKRGVRMTAGYSTAPQCRPSRAGLMTGRFQSRFGLEANGDAGMPWSEYTVAERLGDAGYVTGMCGKWHMDGPVGSNGERPDGTMGERLYGDDAKGGGNRLANPGLANAHGFAEYLCGSMGSYLATHDAEGRDLGGPVVHGDRGFRVDVQAKWAGKFIERHAGGDEPFFLYVPFFAPHVPLEAPDHYLNRFEGEMPRRRRLALAMIAAVDDGVGLITKTLEAEGILGNTLIFYMSDNGAPLKIHKLDEPGGGPGWDGSLNEPWIGEKGMLTEGGIRIPYVVSWPDRLPHGRVYDEAVTTMDATATAVVAGGLKLDDRLDGVDLVPYLTGAKAGEPHEMLFWRWSGQATVRAGRWKYLKYGGREYLFDLEDSRHEGNNLIEEHAELAAKLKGSLAAWSEEMLDPGLDGQLSVAATRYFDHYLDGKIVQHPGRREPRGEVGGGGGDGGGGGVNEAAGLGRFKSRDQDGDHQLTLEEYLGRQVGRNVKVLTDRFKKLDVNADGFLDAGELAGQ